MSARAKRRDAQRAELRGRRGQRARAWRAQAVLGQLHAAELEAVLGWLVHDGTVGQLDDIATRAIQVSEAVRDLHKLDDDTMLVICDMVTAAIATDTMRADQGLADTPDESLNAKLGEINSALFRRKAS